MYISLESCVYVLYVNLYYLKMNPGQMQKK